MNITQNQVKSLARLLSKNSEQPYMICLDAISESLSGLKWNVLKARFDKEETVELEQSFSRKAVKGFETSNIVTCEHDGKTQYDLPNVSDNKEELFFSTDNLTDISVLTENEKKIVDSLDGLVPTEGLLRYLLCRPAPKQLSDTISPRPEVFGKPGHAIARDPAVRMSLFRRFPLLMNILTEWFLTEWKKDPKKAYEIMPDFLPCASEESSATDILSTLKLFGYSQSSIELLSSYQLAYFLSHASKVPLNIPPPIFLNGLELVSILESIRDKKVPIFMVPRAAYCPILMFLENDRGLNEARDWSVVYLAIKAMSRMTQFSSKSGGYISSDTSGWSIINIFQPAKQKYCQWERYRSFLGTTPPEVSPIARRYLNFPDVDALYDAGVRILEMSPPLTFPRTFYISQDKFPDMFMECPQILPNLEDRDSLLKYGKESHVYEDMQKQVQFEFTGVAFPL